MEDLRLGFVMKRRFLPFGKGGGGIGLGDDFDTSICSLIGLPLRRNPCLPAGRPSSFGNSIWR